MSELLYRIALTKVPKVGAVHSKNLIAHCGSAEAVFKTAKTHLTKINGIGPVSYTHLDVYKRQLYES